MRLVFHTQLAGTSVTVGGTLALFAVANVNGAEQINLQVPYEVAGQSSVAVVVNNNGSSNSPVQAPVASAQPGVFTVDGTNGIVVHGASNALVTSSSPAAKSKVVVVYATGLGAVTPAPATGAGAPASPLAATVVTPVITIGGMSAEVLFSGLTPAFVGLYQANVRVPASAPSGNQDLVVITSGAASKAVKIAVQ